MRDKILSFLNTLEFEMNDEHLEDFIMFMNYKLYGIKPNYEGRPPKYFKTLLFLFNKEKI
jgi:hypothetical protein